MGCRKFAAGGGYFAGLDSGPLLGLNGDLRRAAVVGFIRALDGGRRVKLIAKAILLARRAANGRYRWSALTAIAPEQQGWRNYSFKILVDQVVRVYIGAQACKAKSAHSGIIASSSTEQFLSSTAVVEEQQENVMGPGHCSRALSSGTRRRESR